MSFLAIDVGNTRLKWAQYASPQPGAGLIAHGAVFLETIDTLADTDWKGLAPPASMLGCVVAGEGVGHGRLWGEQRARIIAPAVGPPMHSGGGQPRAARRR